MLLAAALASGLCYKSVNGRKQTPRPNRASAASTSVHSLQSSHAQAWHDHKDVSAAKCPYASKFSCTCTVINSFVITLL